jgi:dipeptidyl aminopeptidase/acylaminoacyl peptidase
MRPRLFTVRKVLLFLVAMGIFGSMAYWLSIGAPLPGAGVPSTADKIVFVSDRDGHSDLWMMDAATGENAVALTQDEATDRQPVFNSSGSEIAFVSEGRNGGVVPQIYTIDAKPESKAIPLTNTSASKEQPKFGPEGRIFYLAAGKLAATDPASRETDQLFPEADEVKSLIGTEDNPGILAMGGIAQVAISPDGKRYAAVIKTDIGQALLMVTPGQHAGSGALLGVGKRILCQFLADGRLVASFSDGSPLQQPQPLYNEKMIEGMAVVQAEPFKHLPLPEGQFAVAIFDEQGAPTSGLRLPFGPDVMAASPDGTRVAVASDKRPESDKGKPTFAGLAVLSLTEGTDQSGTPLFDQPVAGATWSADGTKIAFASGKDIYSVPVDGSTPPVNLTKGKGTSSSPAWSPAKPEKK